MGRIVELCGVIAEEAEEGAEGLVLPVEVWERLRQEWDEEDIEDALGLVHESLMQSLLVESADSLSARMLEVLGAFGEAGAFRQAEAGAAVLSVDVIGQLARRVARLEEVLESYREGGSPDRRGFDALQRRLADRGIEEEMEAGRAEDEEAAGRGERGAARPDEDDDE